MRREVTPVLRVSEQAEELLAEALQSEDKKNNLMYFLLMLALIMDRKEMSLSFG